MSGAEVQVSSDVFVEAVSDPRLAAAVEQLRARVNKSPAGDNLEAVAKDGVLKWTVANFAGTAKTSDTGAARYIGTSYSVEYPPTVGTFTLTLTPITATLVLKDDAEGREVTYRGEGVSMGLNNTYSGRWVWFP
ncbi:hypothetical protein SCP_0605460 [Sparassis crispa]|uniref:Uncharacterized protein n=1 Tax=Sparassis crispa TaxID=139825 RepID=A0A401GQR3_9APHY|nr:hypothetical protein SCP_0605460 [Sparassis crispa]GBE84567.1 hypothetical protein SCP_0605460 [Sparassis crispa]